MAEGRLKSRYCLLRAPEFGITHAKHEWHIGYLRIQFQCPLESFRGLGVTVLGVINQAEVREDFGVVRSQAGKFFQQSGGGLRILCSQRLFGLLIIASNRSFICLLPDEGGPQFQEGEQNADEDGYQSSGFLHDEFSSRALIQSSKIITSWPVYRNHGEARRSNWVASCAKVELSSGKHDCENLKGMDREMGKRLFSLVCLLLWLLACGKLSAQTSNRNEIQQHYKRAQVALQSQQPDVAVREFREILGLDPKNAPAHANLGMIAYTQKNYAQAAQDFRTALELRPSLWNATAFLGMTELRLGNGDKAKPLLEDAFRHVQDTKLRTQVGMDLITLYYESNGLDHAVDIVRALGRASPDDPALLFTAYRTYSDLAAHQLARLAQVAPKSAQMHQILAQALASQDDFPGAIAQYRRALEIDPQLPNLHFELGQMILKNSADEPARKEAEKEFKLALAADPANANCEYLLGEIEWLRSKPQEALKHYNQTLMLRPTFVDAHIALGKALTSLGQPEEALKHLLQAINLDPNNEVAYYRLSQAYKKLGRRQEAERALATFGKLRDSHAPVRALYQQIQQGSVRQQTVDPNEPQ